MIQAMIQTVIISGTSRKPRMVFIADGAAWMSQNLEDPLLITGGAAIVGPSEIPQLCQVSGSGMIYVTTRGSDIQQINASTGAMVTYTESAGTMPVGPGLCCIYRDRLVVAGVPGDEQNIFASRLGDHADWDYVQDDPAAAWAGNTGTSGVISDIITALIPLGNDYMILGGDHTLHRVQGDPGYGGSIGKISDKVGIVGPEAWCTDSTGNLYFLSQSGLYRMDPTGALASISGTDIPDYFTQVDRNAYYINVRWDELNKWVWVFCTAKNNTDPSYHVVYDTRFDAWLTDNYPYRFGPVSAMVWDADAPNDSCLMMGTRDNLIERYNPEALTDDSETITSFVYIGPFRLAGEQQEVKFISMQQILGELRDPHSSSDWNLDWAVQVGQDAYTALNNPDQTVTGTTTAGGGAQAPQGLRLSGNSAFVKYSNATNAKTWALDRTSMVLTAGGRER